MEAKQRLNEHRGAAGGQVVDGPASDAKVFGWIPD